MGFPETHVLQLEIRNAKRIYFEDTFDRINPSLGTRGFTIKTWQKPETALEKSLVPGIDKPKPRA